MVNPRKRGVLQIENSDMILPINSRTPASLKSPYCKEQNSQHKRQCTKAHWPDLNVDEVSPQMVVQLIVATKQLVQLATVPLLQDLGDRDLVDSKIWRLLQNNITQSTLQSDAAVEPINIIRDMGFPCVANLPQVFGLSCGELFHSATSLLPEFISGGSAEDEDYNRNIHSYLQCLSNYTISAEHAVIAAQALRELLHRSRNAVQSLQIEFDEVSEHLRICAPTPSTIRYHIQANGQKELAVLVQSLEGLFELTQSIVGDLKEYRLQLQVAQKDVLAVSRTTF
jgi:hypothetical protein